MTIPDAFIDRHTLATESAERDLFGGPLPRRSLAHPGARKELQICTRPARDAAQAVSAWVSKGRA